jgi:hypothetical protein
LLLAPKFQAVGIAWAAVASQAYTVIAFTFILGRARLNPFARALTAPVDEPVYPERRAAGPVLVSVQDDRKLRVG